MSIAFTSLSALGIMVFFKAHDAPVAGLFIGLTGVFVSEFFASQFATPAAAEPARSDGRVREPVGSRGQGLGMLGERALGFFHLGTGLWLMYLTWATALNIAIGYHPPVGAPATERPTASGVRAVPWPVERGNPGSRREQAFRTLRRCSSCSG
jgi:hypothetical protein